jgi:hypothetical protein
VSTHKPHAIPGKNEKREVDCAQFGGRREKKYAHLFSLGPLVIDTLPTSQRSKLQFLSKD